MDVKTYIFQSPYPSAVQLGRPDPLADTSSQDKEAVDALKSTGDVQQREASFYKSQSSAAASVNVALSSTDSALSESLDGFASLNSAVQASAAYES